MSSTPWQDVLALSPFLAEQHRRHPTWLPGLAEEARLDEDRGPRRSTLEASVEAHGLEVGLRRYRYREMTRIVWRELTATATLAQTLGDLSDLAEHVLDVALAIHERELSERYGTPRSPDGEALRLVVLGLGKLGGRELNLSSDIDIIFAFPEAGQCDGRRGLAAETFFTRLAQALIASLSARTADGFCFRVDTRLRPFGEAGPLVSSFGALEQYYQREGRDWERYALVKARPVAGDRGAGAALIDELAPFVYRRYIDYGAVEALRDMLASIRADAARRGREDDVKRGPGGIREVEFLVQCVQLLRGGREPRLRTPSLATALDAIEELALFPADRCDALRDAYAFLRRTENAIQAQHDRQEHRLPAGEDLSRVARIAGCPDADALQHRLAEVRRQVGDALAHSFPRPEGAPPDTDWRAQARAEDSAPWNDFLARLDRLALSDRAGRRLDRFVPILQEALRSAGPPDAAVTDLLGLVLAICRRSAYLALLEQNPGAVARMVKLFTQSHWIADTVARYPALLDELIDPALGRNLPDRADLADTARRLTERARDEEDAVNALTYLRQAQSLRVAVAELDESIGSTDAERHLTVLAEVLLDRMLAVAARAIETRHGRLPGDGLVIVAYGSLGAGDMSYGSDLDLVFLTPPEQGRSDGERPLAAETWHTRLVRRLLALATTATPAGRLYEIDTRLRPNGRSGLLVSSLEAFGAYQRDRAWVWEWQALTRARAVAGNRSLGRHFETLRREVLGLDRSTVPLRQEVADMRRRMREELGDADPLKHGPGGLVDIDFLAQLGVLSCAHRVPDLRETTDTRRQLERLGAAGWLAPDTVATLVDTHRALTRARHLATLCRDGEGSVPDRSAAAAICARHGITEPAGAAESG